MSDIPVQSPARLTDEQMNALIAKHRPEIDRIKSLDSKGERGAFKELGIDPKALEDHYQNLQNKSLELREADARANKNVTRTGIVSSIIGGGGMAAFAYNRPNVSKIVKVSSVLLAAPVAALAGTFVASRAFISKIRNQSRDLDVEAKNAFERELAVALENRMREVAASKEQGAPAAEPSMQTVATNVPKRDVSYVAQADADKSATITIQTR